MMKKPRPIHAHPLSLSRSLAALVLLAAAPGCELKVADLDAGSGDEAEGSDDEAEAAEDTGEALVQECLLATEADAVGVEQSSTDPLCPVTCAEGWGHDGAQLPIAWTTPLVTSPASSSPYALGVLASGSIVAALTADGAVFLNFFEKSGLNIGGYDVFDLGSQIDAVEIANGTVYISHGDGLGTFEVRAVDISSQQELWRRSLPGDRSGKLARGGGALATVATIEGEDTTYTLHVLDLAGEPQWSAPVSDPGPVAVSPSGARLALGGERTQVFAAEDGALLDEFVHGALPIIYAQDVAFLDEDRLVTVGIGIELERFDGWLAGDSLAGAPSWEQVYNRADSWCPEPGEDPGASATADLLVELAVLPDGSVVVIGSENYQSAGILGGQPWVAQVDGAAGAVGSFLGSDRGVWNGYGAAVAAGSDGSVFALMVDVDPDAGDVGFRLRKYLP